VEDFFRDQEGRPALESVTVNGVELEKGSRVLLWPRAGGDIMDVALKGKVAFVESIEQDFEDRVYIAVTLEDDPGRDLGEDRFLGHRFFFSPEEVEPLDFEIPHE
jgi:hydrogenase maturation protease